METDDCAELLEAVDSSFWDAPYPHSLLKHAILAGYLPVFATKTASNPSTGGRVVFVDGYAGAGRYRSGHDGSPLIALDAAQKLASYTQPRKLDCVFVERNRKTFRALECVVAGQGECLSGDLRRHLTTVLKRAYGVPLFMFLDPYGFLPSMQELVDRVLLRDADSPDRWPTELLVSLMTFSIGRQAEHRRSDDPTRSQTGTIKSLDDFMDGSWWQEVVDDRDRTDEEKEHDLAVGWADRLVARAPSYQAWVVPIPRRWEEPGYYYLVLVTAHDQGGWFFASGLPKALEKFYEIAVEGSPQLFGPTYSLQAGRDAMRANLRRLLNERNEFMLSSVTRELYEGALGKAGIKELVVVVKELRDGAHPELEVVSGKVTQKHLHRCVVRPTGTASLGV